MNSPTLSHQLFIRIVPTILITILVIGGFAFYSADKEINTVYDAQLISNGNVLWDLLTDELNAAEAGTSKKVEDIDLPSANLVGAQGTADQYADSRMFRVWKEQKILLYSDTAFPENVPMQRVGFSTVNYQGDDWRIYHLPIPGQNIAIEVGEKIALRNTLVHNILLNLAIPLILLVPVVNVLIWFGINSGIATIRTLVQQILSRSPDDLSPMDIKPLPRDLAPLGKSINQLLTKLQYSFTAEKRFSDHAAHQLRTPLTTLKLQLQMLAQSSDEQERDTLMKELLESSDRAAKLVGQLLTSARLSSQTLVLNPIAIYPMIASVMAEFGTLAMQKQLDMSLEGDEMISLRSDEILIKLMLSNIIENAVKYTPPGGHLRVEIAREAKWLKISITDTGPGIPEEMRKLVFERFYRANAPQAEGSGLGLAIVAEILERLSGKIDLKTPLSGQGLLVELSLPAT